MNHSDVAQATRTKIGKLKQPKLVYRTTGEAYGAGGGGNALPNSQITGLVIGRTYRITARIMFRIDSGGFSAQTIHCWALNNGVEIARASMRFDSASAADTDMGTSLNCVFVAAGTTLDFVAFGGSVSRVRPSQIIVEECNPHEINASGAF